MTGRAKLATAILAIWTATLAWHVKRQYFRPLEEVLAEAAVTLPSGTAYYAVYAGDERVGWAQSHVDTLPDRSGFVVEDRLEARLPGLGGAPTFLETRVVLGPTLRLKTFTVVARSPLGPFSARGSVEGDSALRIVVSRNGPPDSVRIPLEGPVVPATSLALRLAAERTLEPGDRISVAVFDPVTLSQRIAQLRVIDRQTRTFPDSADTDPAGRWLAARLDTVRAWLVEQEVAGLPLRSWIDEDGRLLEAEVGGGVRLERTAFELAYYPYRETR